MNRASYLKSVMHVFKLNLINFTLTYDHIKIYSFARSKIYIMLININYKY